jgi:hypothetical protein
MGQSTDDQRGRESVYVRLPSQAYIERLEPLRGFEQKRRSITAWVVDEDDLRAQ